MPKTLIEYKNNYIDIKQGFSRLGNYGGFNGIKRTWEYNNCEYMTKSQERNKNTGKFKTVLDQPILFYNNSILSEYVASSVINFINFNNIKAQTTFLIKQEMDELELKKELEFEELNHLDSINPFHFKTKFWVACELVVQPLKNNENKRQTFIPIVTLSDYLYGDKNLNERNSRMFDNISFNEMIEWINNQNYINKNDFVNYFYDLFILDALLLNWDRNPTNWGLIATYYKNVNGYEESFSFAPLIDQGSTLFAKQDSKGFETIKSLTNNEEIDQVIKNTKSFFLDDNKQKIVYLDYFKNTNDKKMLEHLKIFFNQTDINKLIDEIHSLNLPLKYKQNYQLLIKRSFELLVESTKNNPNFID